jgi:hypothetical protein
LDAELDLSRLTFKFAKSMPETPHWYVVRTPANEADYIALFHVIQEKGVPEKFGARKYRYWRPGDGFKYWAMTTDAQHSHVINRAKDGAASNEARPAAGKARRLARARPTPIRTRREARASHD